MTWAIVFSFRGTVVAKAGGAEEIVYADIGAYYFPNSSVCLFVMENGFHLLL